MSLHWCRIYYISNMPTLSPSGEFKTLVRHGDDMKRNWDTIREILTRLEDSGGYGGTFHLSLSSFPSERATEISYHMELLFEADLVDGKMLKHLGPGPYNFSASRLTWRGHEFLDAVCNDTVWQKTKKSFVSNGISMTFDLVKSVASDVAASIIKSAIAS